MCGLNNICKAKSNIYLYDDIYLSLNKRMAYSWEFVFLPIYYMT